MWAHTKSITEVFRCQYDRYRFTCADAGLGEGKAGATKLQRSALPGAGDDDHGGVDPGGDEAIRAAGRSYRGIDCDMDPAGAVLLPESEERKRRLTRRCKVQGNIKCMWISRCIC